MKLSVCIQDPTHAGTTYLYEAILEAAKQAATWRGLYAFASRDGVDHLIEDGIVQDMLENGGGIDLLVGIDAVTDRVALERLRELEERHDGFRPRVFWNEARGLFHPKISDFGLPNGGRIVIVGSGNLTPGGLMGNFEAYTIISAERSGEIDAGPVTKFLERHADCIRCIDDEALERAAANIIRPLAGTRHGGVRIRRRVAGGKPRATTARDAAGFGRILLAHVPKAGARWSQVHFNAQVIEDYFRLTRIDTQRVYLTQVSADATRSEVEVRPCVFSTDSNRNYRIEVGAAKHLEYPEDRPILIFRERQLRTYDYMMLLPGEDGYETILELSDRLPSLGRGLPRILTDTAKLEEVWPDCPLLQVPPREAEDV